MGQADEAGRVVATTGPASWAGRIHAVAGEIAARGRASPGRRPAAVPSA